MRRLPLCVAVVPVLVAVLPATSASAARRGEISFRAPIHFATGATPTSAEFNRTEGEQIVHMSRRAPMSDAVAVGDFDHDENPDVAQTNVIAGSVSIFLGDGRGGFALPQLHPVGEHPVFVVTGDLDRDGELDLAVANYGSNNVAVLRGKGDGGFHAASFLTVPVPRNVAIGAFNGDDIPDLAVASSTPSVISPFTPPQATAGTVTVLMGTATGRFVQAQVIGTTAGPRPVNAHHVSAGDFDGDGYDDLAVGVGVSPNAGNPQPDGTVTGDDTLIFRNRGEPFAAAQPFSAAPDQRIRVGAWPAAIGVADLDGDTDPDLTVVDAASGDVTTLVGDGEGRFVVRAVNGSVGSFSLSSGLADFDDDGDVDLATASFMSSTVSVLAGNGDGTFAPAVDFWSGDATTSVAAGDFNGDGRSDLVAGRLRDDHLVLLLNESPQPGDGVRIHRDIRYDTTPNDPFPAHHMLDMYLPPKGMTSFAGGGRPYPVVVWAHGGGGITGDKSMGSYLMRSLAREGIVAVSTDYRLGWDLPAADKTGDIARAFRWIRDHVGLREFGGDPGNMFAFGYSAGAVGLADIATSRQYVVEQKSIRGLVLTGVPDIMPGDADVLPPSLLFSGDESGERDGTRFAAAFAAACRARGAEATHVIVPRRDHVTINPNLAQVSDPGRAPLLSFMRRHLLVRPQGTPGSAAQPAQPLPATGASDGWPALGALLFAVAAARLRPGKAPGGSRGI